MTPDLISPDLKTVLRRLNLSRMLDTRPERLSLARQQPLAYQDFLLIALGDEAACRDALTVTTRVLRAHLDPSMDLDAWAPTANVTFDRTLLNDLASLHLPGSTTATKPSSANSSPSISSSSMTLPSTAWMPPRAAIPTTCSPNGTGPGRSS